MNQFTTSDGLTLAYRDEGSGPPVLCLPGLSRNGDDFQPVVDAMSDQYRIIRLDLRGRGASAYDPEYLNYNIPVEARDTVELLDHLGLERAIILGTSRGGLIALTLAAMAVHRLQGVVFNDIGPEVDPVGMGRIMEFLGLKPRFPTLDAAAKDVAVQSAAQFPDVDAAKWRWYLSNGWRETSDGLELRYDPKLRNAVEQSLGDGPLPDIWPLFDLLKGVPLGLIRGENSDILSASTAAEMQRRRPDMATATVGNRGHVPFLDEPESLSLLTSYLGALR